MLNKIIVFILFFEIVFARLAAKASDAEEISIWPNQKEFISAIGPTAVDAKLIVYRPLKINTKAAVIVFPGGSYKYLAIDKGSTIGENGADVCKWLTDSGITCFLLKYRVPNSGCYWDEKTKKHVTPKIPMALQDAQRAISLIRYNAKKYEIDPGKIGVLGFSAGGNLAVLASTSFKKKTYPALDEVDQVSCRPDFAIPVYPGHMTMEHKNKKPQKVASQELNTDILISSDIPQTLLIHAKDDPIDPSYYSEVYEKELKKANVEVKLILYKSGGHAFGVKKQNKDSDQWTNDAITWLKEIKVL